MIEQKSEEARRETQTHQSGAQLPAADFPALARWWMEHNLEQWWHREF